MTASAVPFIFTNNTTADGPQVNSNFAALVSDLNAIDTGQITTGSLAIARLPTITADKLSLTQLTNSLSGDVALNNTANYFDGPSVAQGATGTWFASGTVTVGNCPGADIIDAKLWDGTTVIASAAVIADGTAGHGVVIALSGFLATPAGNIRISVKDATSTSALIKFNSSGNSKDSTISVFRIN